MFSGQGSQYYQMGSDLYTTDTVFRDAMDRCSRHVSAAIGTSLSDLIYQPRADRFAPFDRTLYTHPALFSVQYSLAQALRARGLSPTLVLGYSLGEWVAHVVAGVITPEAALDLLVQQARVVERESPPGGMLAVFESRDLMARHPDWFAQTSLAADNFDRHFVVSGLSHVIAATEAHLKQAGITAQVIPVRQAFHSAWMDPFEAECRRALLAVPSRPAAMPVVSSRGAVVTDTALPETLWRAAREPVAFRQTLAMLERDQTPTYIDCGPSGTLATFAKYNLPKHAQHRCVSLITPFGRNVERVDALTQPSPIGERA